jgi:hypothetical protein
MYTNDVYLKSYLSQGIAQCQDSSDTFSFSQCAPNDTFRQNAENGHVATTGALRTDPEKSAQGQRGRSAAEFLIREQLGRRHSSGEIFDTTFRKKEETGRMDFAQELSGATGIYSLR